MTQSSNAILLRQAGAVSVLTMNRPEVRNAFDFAAAREMVAAVDRAEADPQTCVVIVTGAGPAFCTGADLRARLRGEPRAVIDPFGFAGFVRKPRAKPFIAAVNGYAVGGGFEIAMACDLVVASPDASFALPEVGRGLIAAGDCLPFLCSRLPRAIAVDLALSGRRLPAQEAMALGLVNAVGPDVLQLAMEWAARICANAPLAVAGTLELIRALDGGQKAGYYEMADAIQRRLLLTQDAAEGSLAAVEKRAPRWQGA